jgi:hypothetical protein
VAPECFLRLLSVGDDTGHQTLVPHKTQLKNINKKPKLMAVERISPQPETLEFRRWDHEFLRAFLRMMKLANDATTCGARFKNTCKVNDGGAARNELQNGNSNT